MKYICNFCTTEFFSAAENLDGTKCWNCKKGRVANAETELIDAFLAELDKELEEFTADLGLDNLFSLEGYEVNLELCRNLQCEQCGEDCGDEPLALDPDLMKKHPEMFGLTAESYPDGLFSGLKEIGKEASKSLLAKTYNSIERKTGEYCRKCVYYQTDFRTEGKTHYSEGNCTIENWKRKLAFDWCKCYKRKKNTRR